MKSLRVLIGLSVLLLTVGWLIWDRVHTFSPTPETESAFLKNYTPTNVMKRFNDGRGVTGSGRGAAAGHHSVTHTSNFDGYFALRSEKFWPLMDALRDDVATQLAGNGARILSQVGEARAGFRFEYKLGKTVGSVTIAPLELTPLLSRIEPLPDGVVDVYSRIDVAERWFPKEPGLIQVSVNNSMQ
jgi:hypothetical protein